MTLNRDGVYPQAADSHHQPQHHQHVKADSDLPLKAKLFRLKKLDPHQDSTSNGSAGEAGNDESHFKVRRYKEA